ncbi:hypothetical protein [Cellulomonas cellasea]|nr:hypothetical protein [Cellulomonas cellasea]
MTVRKLTRMLATTTMATAMVVVGAVTATSAPAVTAAAAAVPPNDTLAWDGYEWERLGSGGGHQGVYRTENVRVKDNGDLVITAMRHCTPGSLTGSDDPHPEPCADLSDTKYSIGRLNLFGVVPQGQDFTLKFVATMPQRHSAGARSALWANNVDQGPGVGYCGAQSTSPLGEIDVIEWYSAKPNQTTQSTHAGCITTGDGQHELSTTTTKGTEAFDPAERTTFTATKRGSTVTYRVNGVRVARHVCGTNPKPNNDFTCAEIMSRPWNVIMQTEVFKGPAGDGKFDGPSRRERFPTQRLVVHDVSITTMAAGAASADD